MATVGFRPDTKCCTYHPTLPNFLVGAVFSDASSAMEPARAALRAKIAGRIGISPRWVAAPRKYLVLLHAARESSFGRSEALLCPYYARESGTCGIWRYREVICATFFCKHTLGALGHSFWTAVKRLVAHAEARLAEHVAREVGPSTWEPSVARGKLTREDLEDRPPESYAKMWQGWEGREEEFYVECARRVSAMKPEDAAPFVQDEEGRAIADEVRALHERLRQPEIASHLALSPDLVVEPGEAGVGVTSYSRYDSFFLSTALYEALGKFTHAEPVSAVLERLKREHGIELPDGLLLQMQLQGIVVPPAKG
jgi:hypothetical protein